LQVVREEDEEEAAEATMAEASMPNHRVSYQTLRKAALTMA